MIRLPVALALLGVIALIGCGGGTDTPKADRGTEVESASAEKVTLNADLSLAERAAIEKELAEGPRNDVLRPDLRTVLEERYGPILPQLPFRMMRPFLPLRVGEWQLTQLHSQNITGFPSVEAYYHRMPAGGREKDQRPGPAQRVSVEIVDDRLEKGSSQAYMRAAMEEAGKKRDPNWKPRWWTEDVRGFSATLSDQKKGYQWMRVKAGRFGVMIETDDMKVIRQFATEIDLEKLSKTN